MFHHVLSPSIIHLRCHQGVCISGGTSICCQNPRSGACGARQTGRTSQPTAPSLPRLPRGSEIWRRLQPVAGPCCPTCYLMPRAREFLAICWANCRRVEQWMPNSTTTQSLGSALNDYTLTVIWLVLDDCVNYNARGQISPGVAGGWPIISSPAMSCHYGAETPCAIQVFKGVCSILCT